MLFSLEAFLPLGETDRPRLDNFEVYLAVFLTGLLVTYLLTPWVRKTATRLGIIDLPNERRPHGKPTPRAGGVAVVLGVQAACLMALALGRGNSVAGLDAHWWFDVTLASLVVVVVGLLDDIVGLRPWTKLAGQILAAALVCFSGARFGELFGFTLPAGLDWLLVIIWIVAVINAFNLIDGLDGLACGLAIISAIGLCGIFLLGHLSGNLLVLIGLIGACLGFLRYNFHPASIFLGDTGSMFLGFTLAVVSLQTFTKSTFVLSLTIPLLVLGVPIYDEILAVWRRSVRRWLNRGEPSSASGHNGIMQADLEHLHHRLVKAGLSTGRAATVLCILNGALVISGLLITTFKSHAYGIFLLALLGGVYVVMRHLAVIELRDTGRVILQGLRRPTHATFKALGYPVWDMACLAGAVALAMRLFEPPRPDFWHAWFLDLPLWVTPTFMLLAASRTYVTVWTRARLLDVLMLESTLVLGLILSLGIALLIDPANASRWVLRALVVGGLSHPAIVCLRVIYRSVEELVNYFRAKAELKPDSQRVVLYGAGGRCQLFLKERSFHNSSSFDGRIIVGLIDDEPALQGQWVYGYPVLGGSKDLPQLTARHHISTIIITAGLTPESRAAIQQLALNLGLELSEWSFTEQKLRTDSAEQSRPLYA